MIKKLAVALLVAISVVLLLACAYLWHRAERSAVACSWRDYRAEYAEQLLVTEERMVRTGSKVHVWGQFYGYGAMAPMDLAQVQTNVKLFFGFDPRELLVTGVVSYGEQALCELDSDMNVISVDTLAFYRPGSPPWKASIGRLSSLPEIGHGLLRLAAPVHLVGPARPTGIDHGVFDYSYPKLWLSLAPASGQPGVVVQSVPAYRMEVIVPQGAKTGWVCALMDLAQKPTGGYTARIIWSTYGGYVYVK